MKRTHYEKEKALATRLRTSTQDERKTLYTQIYKEYFESFPEEREERHDVLKEYAVIKKFLKPDTSFLEIGTGYGHFAKEVITHVSSVTTIDVAEATETKKFLDARVTFMPFNGITAELPAHAFDVAYSNQVLEHVHPDDVAAHLDMVARALKPSGSYIIITPHRLAGPHDSSRGFAEVAQGLHLKEYTYDELSRMMVTYGLSSCEAYYMRNRFSFRVPLRGMILIERALGSIPWYWLRQKLARLVLPQIMVVLKK